MLGAERLSSALAEEKKQRTFIILSRLDFHSVHFVLFSAKERGILLLPNWSVSLSRENKYFNLNLHLRTAAHFLQ